LFKKGDPQKFVEKEISWSLILPDVMAFIFPIVGGIILLIRDFTWLLAIMLAIFGILFLGGNVVIREALACKYCRQRELGCPAEKLFGKEEVQNK
jgi:hypothetical protein